MSNEEFDRMAAGILAAKEAVDHLEHYLREARKDTDEKIQSLNASMQALKESQNKLD